MSKPSTRPGAPELEDAPVVSRDLFAAALPAVHPLAALGELPFDEYAAAGLDKVLHAGEEIVRGAERLAAQSCAAGEIDQAGEAVQRDSWFT